MVNFENVSYVDKHGGGKRIDRVGAGQVWGVPYNDKVYTVVLAQVDDGMIQMLVIDPSLVVGRMGYSVKVQNVYHLTEDEVKSLWSNMFCGSNGLANSVYYGEITGVTWK